MTAYNGWTYTYQGGRQLATASTTGKNLSFAYNDAGLRISKIYNGTVHTYTYNGSLLASDVTDDDSLYFRYDQNGAPIGFAYEGDVGTGEYYYLKNLQGDITGVVDTSGNRIATYVYDAWGNHLSITGSNTDLANKNPLRYRGYQFDPETELYYLQSRYYSPAIGRFISADSYAMTYETPVGANMFAYCGNNPVVNIDPTGDIFGTLFDIASLGYSIYQAAKNPDDPMAKLAVVADAASLLLPMVSGGGAAVRVAAKVDDVHDIAKGWKVGDNITNLTKSGNAPSWATVRQRYWKNEAHFNGNLYDDDNLGRMKKGLAPLVKYEGNGKMYSMELHHKIARRDGGTNDISNLIQVTPWEHAAIDPFRHFKP